MCGHMCGHMAQIGGYGSSGVTDELIEYLFEDGEFSTRVESSCI